MQYNAVNGVLPKIQGHAVDWVLELIVRYLSTSPDNSPSLSEILIFQKLITQFFFFWEKKSKNKNYTVINFIYTLLD